MVGLGPGRRSLGFLDGPGLCFLNPVRPPPPLILVLLWQVEREEEVGKGAGGAALFTE
jgi:hypothetical protein